jgi:hypothetical protein
MPLYHLLAQPLALPAQPGKRIWACLCGQKVSLPDGQPKSQVIQTPNNRVEIMECPACYNATEEEGEEAPPVTEAGDIKPTFDQDLGDAADDQEVPEETTGDGEVLKEERVDFPDT